MACWPGSVVKGIHFGESLDDNLWEDGVGSKCEKISALDTLASHNKDVEEAPIIPSTRNKMVFERRLWKFLLEAIFDLILMRLPLTAQCQFRCVCQDWRSRRLLPSLSCSKETLPAYMIMTNLEQGTTRLLCHQGEKWVSLPHNAHPSWEISPKRELLDVEAGLFCYLCTLRGHSWLSMCNPLTHFERVIAINFEFSRRDGLKLLVNREHKTFKVVAPNERLLHACVYNLTMASWRFCFGLPIWPRLNKLFVWKNIVYAYRSNEEPEAVSWESYLMAFNLEARQWDLVSIKFLDESKVWDRNPRKKFIVSYEDHMMLIQVYCSSDNKRFSYLSMWKLLDHGSNGPNVALTRSKWEKVNIGSNRVTQYIAGKCPGLGHVCYGNQNICFMFFRYWRCKHESPKTRTLTANILRFSLTTQNWNVVACPRGSEKALKFYQWEPSLDIDTKLNTTQEDGCSMEDVHMENSFL